MNLLIAAVLLLAALLALSAIVTRFGVRSIERANPPTGDFATVNGTRMHYVLDRAGPDADLPPILFLHGASGNLKDQQVAFGEKLRGRADLVFVDRPGHGWSERGPSSNAWPDGQAATLAALLDHLGIEKAIVVGHSFGGAIAVSFALDQPEKTAGVLLLAPVSHPWPGGISWYYNLTALPVIGWLFARTLALPFGLQRVKDGVDGVFTPNRAVDGYAERTGVPLLLRPRHFRANAIDVANLLDYVKRVSPRYREIGSPAVVITGDRDAVVLPRVHSIGLKESLPNVELVWVKNLGHKPDYIATDLAIAGLEKLAGRDRDLTAEAARLEEAIASDRFGPYERCFT